MGYYIETESNSDKANSIAKKWGGRIVSYPPPYESLDQAGEVLVVVVHNEFFEAAAICFSSDEQAALCDVSDKRLRMFVILPKEKAVDEHF